MIDRLFDAAIDLAERGRLPDRVIRQGVRRLCRQRLREVSTGTESDQRGAYDTLLQGMAHGPVAPVPDQANAQHYEAPVELFERALGPHLKYSSGYWPDGVTTLAAAEAAALALTCDHAALTDGQDVLELGCGWGSLTLWMAERYPTSRILGVSNSHRQRAFILDRAATRGLSNLEIVTADMNEFTTPRRFDRVVSVEMFEHMRNYAELLRRISGWLTPDGSLFIHIFCHRQFAYPYATEGSGNWLGRHFFTGGLMPSASLLRDFQQHVHVTQQWQWNGLHYARTANAWLANLDAHREALRPVFERHYGAADADRWFGRWRMFFMACAELWGYDDGREWQVGHYRLDRGGAGERRASGEAA
jgi:cyclopropane-fatty-acyl-phospholipid synthase